ncbi:hypothetical protein K1719_030014 [Acacia pycnantha]|nr:hypothetical protein K1719_030014 [Acacia pycnantha]
MASFLLDLAKNEVQSLVNLVKNEAQYLCCFNSYVENFEQKKEILAAKHKDVKTEFQKGKGVFNFKFEVQEWEREAYDIIHIDTKVKKNLFLGLCPNCWSQYRTGKKLAEKTQHIEKLLERCNSNIVAGRANVLDIIYFSSQGFIHFESRESKFQDLLKKLQDENCNMIGLQGLGGTGKTSMAKEVGHKLKESKLIDKFIFLVVSQPPDFKKIRGELARNLDLNLDEVKEELSSTILSRIINMDQKLLIILDDVWVEFDVTEKLGIPFGHQQKGCNLLITTRSSHVCTKMGCQMIQLHTLTNEEALNLFESHVGLNNSYHGFNRVTKKIVKYCGGVPVAIVALARALKNQPISAWKDALKTLEDRGIDQNLEEAYKCLKLSYDNLKRQKAKELLLISSLFPWDFKIPIKLLIKIGIGLGSFKENDKYHSIRSEVHGAIMELIYSSLLLNDEEECVKMHDLIREVALWIGENDIQFLLGLEKPIKGNLRYLFWNTNKFPDEIDGNKLEYLSIFLDDLEGFNVTDTFFKKMTSIKVLIIYNVQICPALSLINSLQPLKSVQTLILTGLELGDICVLGNLLTLMALWFVSCSIDELPKEFFKLKKLSSLEVEACKIKRKNPFEVIEMCSQLEELTFVCNECVDEEKDAISHNGSPLTLHRYCISSEDVLDYSKREDGQRMWKTLVPDIVPIDKQGVMNDLIVLHLSSHPNMEYLIDTKDCDPSMSAFFNLTKLYLCEVGIEDLCRGPPPSGFFEQLEILKLTRCSELKSILFNANYNLCQLESMELEDCPKLMSVFQPYTARSLIQLKKLTINDCSALEYIIVGEDGDSNEKNYYESLFPSLEEMKLFGVPSFIGIVREYHQLMSSSMHKQSPPLSRHNSRNVNQSLATHAFSWVQACCSFNKLRHTSEEANITIFEDRPLDHTNPPVIEMCLNTLKSLQVCDVKIEEIFYLTYMETEKKGDELQPLTSSLRELRLLNLRELVNICWGPKCIIRFDSLRDLTIKACKKLRVIFSASIVRSLPVLWQLDISECEELVHIVEEDYETNADDHVRHEPCFPNLEQVSVSHCDKLKYLFSITISDILPKLSFIWIDNAYELEHVLIKRDEMKEMFMENVLPPRRQFTLSNLPNLISIFRGINTLQLLNIKRDLKSGNSQVEEKAEERLSSHMGEEITQQSFTKVVEARAKGVSTSLNQATSSILSKSSDDDDVQVYDKSHPHSTNLYEGVDHGDIKEACMVQNEYDSNVEPSSLTRREQESSYSKGQIQTKDQLIDSQPISAMPTTPFVTISQDEHSEILGCYIKAVSSLPPGKEHKTSNQGDPFVPPMPIISSEQQASDTIIPLSFVPSKALTRPKQISMSASSQSTYGGRNVQENVGTTNNQPMHESLDASQIYSNSCGHTITCQLTESGSSEMASSICNIKNASSVVGVKEIVNMMKLEGFDKDWLESIRIKVFNCDASEFHHKQQVLKSLGNKLEANKRALANVRNQEAKATQSVEMAQKKLEATHKELEAAYKGLEAAQSHLNVAQQEYANIRVRHSKLLEECQEILEQRDQCSEIIAAKLRPFGF